MVATRQAQGSRRALPQSKLVPADASADALTNQQYAVVPMVSECQTQYCFWLAPDSLHAACFPMLEAFYCGT